MKITDAKVFVGGPGKNYVTLKIMTDTGVYGIGDATLNNRETLPAKYLTDYLIPNIIGMDPRQSEDIWQMMYRGAYFRGGPIAMAAYGAIDMALWDIKGKLAGMPLYQLFGGKSTLPISAGSTPKSKCGTPTNTCALCPMLWQRSAKHLALT